MFRSFVSEKEIEEVKQKRQEEWEKVRKPDQPLGKLQKLLSHIIIHSFLLLVPWRSIDLSFLNTPVERPEEAYDHRTLYDRLKQQKDKKQEEHDDQYKFSEFP